VLTLALDTSSESGSIAVLRDERVIGVVSTTTDETYSSRIFRQLTFLLAEVSLRLDSFDLVAVNGGPGSFTGLRVGLTMSKAWSEVHSRPIAAVAGLEAVAAQCVGTGAARLVPVLDARRGQLYAGLYRRTTDGAGASQLVAETEAVVIAPLELLAWLAELPGRSEAIIATPSATWLASLLPTENGASMRPPIQQVPAVLAPAIGALGRAKFQRGETVDALRLDANYVRRTDAEMHWKEK
jgi:tRNA threonylcarbamoyladenosine biosynthesis protein TsaB